MRFFGGRSHTTISATTSSSAHTMATVPRRGFSGGVTGFKSKDRENYTEEEWADYNEMDEMEKLRRDPSLYQSPLSIDTESTSERLLDDAWIIDPAKREGTVIWLHGIGEGMAEAKKIFEMLAPKNMRIVIPKAPYIPITALDEEEHNTWYDIESAVFTDEVDEDYRGINESTAKVMQLLDEEIQLVDPGRIILAGFGQGGAVAIHAGCDHFRINTHIL
jgi:poly(3-hydroxybutyrate) depolymerase